ncbi:hypothetical protein ACLK19_15740 [Escherichia coli]
MNWAVKAVTCATAPGLGRDELKKPAAWDLSGEEPASSRTDSEACRELARQACERRSAQEIEALLTAFTPEEDVRPLLALEISLLIAILAKEQVIEFLCGNLGVNGRTATSV